MSGNADEAKGRAKEAAGALTGDEGLEQEGRMDQAGAKVKDLAEKAKDAVENAVDSVKEKLHRH
jgi:uncharacterized protein YjbJ (UPF0337 family)